MRDERVLRDHRRFRRGGPNGPTCDFRRLRPSAVSGLLLAALVTFGWPAVGRAQSRVGPAAGSLIAAGGAAEDPAIFQRFLELAGGPDVPIVVIPTAGERQEYDGSFRGLEPLREAGAGHLTLLHTRDRAQADSEEFVRPIREARGVWFSGGRQWRLVDAYMGTRTLEELRELLARGGVIGGSSAGATILGSLLVRGDTRTNTIMMGDHQDGFAFLRGVAIDQHLLRRNRQFDLVEVIEAHPELLGIGLDENTAIVVQGDAFEVIGQSYVAIYDPSRIAAGQDPFYFLAPGDRFDLAERRRIEP
ncbi:MAG: cyanophycinase [Gemmatimonadota bacterium]